ncbi:MAG: amino acid permease [Planctomycetota bacterium]|jgi:amino acid transporter
MESSRPRKLSLTTVGMIIVVTTFSIANVVDNLAQLGQAAIPSWIVVGFVYFLPLALILAEFASDTTASTGGIYSYMERGLGPTWAFVGTWSYFVANLVYLQSVFSRLPIRISLAVTGEDVFDAQTVLLPVLGVLLCVVLTFVCTRGVRVFARLADWMAKGTLVLVALLLVVPFAYAALGLRESANAFTLAELTPSFDLEYFSTFAWLLFAVAGAEVAAPYVKHVKDPVRSFPRAILLSTLLIGGVYVLASVAVALLHPLPTLTKATGLYDIWIDLAPLLGLPPVAFARATMTFIVVASLAAYVIWMESPVRAMFAEVPRGTFPETLTRHDDEGTHHRALWTQAAVVSVLILLPLLSIVSGLSGSERFLSLLNDLASLSLVVPYVFIALAYIKARRAGMDAPFKMVRSTPMAVAIGVLVLVVSGCGYLGAGLFALQADQVDWIYVGLVYGGPIALILLGLGLRRLSLAAHREPR